MSFAKCAVILFSRIQHMDPALNPDQTNHMEKG